MTNLNKDMGSGTSLGSRSALRIVLALGLAGAALAGCGTSAPAITGSLPEDGYRTRYPITLQEGEETLDIPVGYGSAGLSASGRENVRAFAAATAERGTSGLVILAPSGSGNQAAASAVAREARQEAMEAGLSGKLVELRHYAVGDSSVAAPVRLVYTRIKAVSPRCGEWTEQLLAGPDNGDGAEFGCATQANLAAMVSNPEDLITPRVSTPANGNRRLVLWRKWVNGEQTSTGQTLDGSQTTGGN